MFTYYLNTNLSGPQEFAINEFDWIKIRLEQQLMPLSRNRSKSALISGRGRFIICTAMKKNQREITRVREWKKCVCAWERERYRVPASFSLSLFEIARLKAVKTSCVCVEEERGKQLSGKGQWKESSSVLWLCSLRTYIWHFQWIIKKVKTG